MIAETPTRRASSRQSEHIFYIGMAIAAIAIAFAGFAKSFFLRPYFSNPQTLSLTTQVHGVAFTAWVVLLLIQSTLIASRRTDIHRALGWIGAALAAFMVIITVKTAIMAVHAAVVCCNADLARGFLIIPFADVVVFGVLVGYAVAYRRESGTHKRLMLLATLAILDAATGRWPWRFVQAGAYNYVVLLDLIILAVVAYDTAVRRHLARAYAWGVPLVIASHVIREILRATPTWKAFAQMIVG